jgi:3-hydroxybutyryl-CoA dehydrogenase
VNGLSPGSTASSTIVGVVGAGTMGAGIAQVALEGGHFVRINDVDPDAVERSRARIADGLRRRAIRQGHSDTDTDDLVRTRMDRLSNATDLLELAAGAAVVIEAALEDLALKQSIFRALDVAAPRETILATNTSALSVGAIASATTRPERVVGLHFFNPAPVMRLVEIVGPPEADQEVIDRSVALTTAWGKTPVRSADSPGFIVNRVNRPFTLEALRILEGGAGSVEGIDAAIREAGFPMGPFELMDLVGIDINLAAARGLYEGFGRAPRFRPSPIQEALVELGRLGRKTGSGFYRYDASGGASNGIGSDVARILRERDLEDRHATSLAQAEIVERIVLGIVNEAFHALGERVATTEDIDLALRLGAGHPVGPFERVVQLGGPRLVVERLRRLERSTDVQFAPAPLLAQAAN